MNGSRFWLAIPVALLMTACGGDATDDDLVITDGEPGMAMEEVAPPGPAMDMPAMPMTAQLQALQDSGVNGEATVTGRGAQTEVMVRLTGATANATYPGHIHSGTCAAVGGVVQPLQPITADATGAGTMTVTVDVPGNTTMNGQHIVVYHNEGGTPVTCAAIPAHMM